MAERKIVCMLCKQRFDACMKFIPVEIVVVTIVIDVINVNVIIINASVSVIIPPTIYIFAFIPSIFYRSFEN